jgi:hypothetical protein
MTSSPRSRARFKCFKFPLSEARVIGHFGFGRRHLAAERTAASGLLRYAPAVVENAAIQQVLDERDLFGQWIVAPDLAFHRLRRAAAVQRDD